VRPDGLAEPTLRPEGKRVAEMLGVDRRRPRQQNDAGSGWQNRSPTDVSTLAVNPITGPTGRRRMVSWAIAAARSNLLAISTLVAASDEPRIRSASSRGGAIRSGLSSRWCTAQESVFAVVSSPAKSTCIKFAKITSSENAIPSSSPAATIASTKFDGRSARSGSAASFARGADQLIQPCPQLREGLLELPVLRKAHVAPEREGREEATNQGRKNQVQFALNEIVVPLDRIGVIAESEQCRDVDGVTLELVDEVERGASVGLPPPTFEQPQGDGLDSRVKAAQVSLRQRGRREFALPAPAVSRRGKDAVEVHLRKKSRSGWRRD
jgi:hypothetical protein